MRKSPVSKLGTVLGAATALLSALAVPAPLQGQRIVSPVGLQTYFHHGAVSGTYDAATTAYFAAMTSQPSPSRKALLATLVTCVEASGAFANLDRLFVLASFDSQPSRINMINPTEILDVFGNPTFTADRGWSGGNGPDYIKAQTALFSTHYTLNQATMGFWYNSLGSGRGIMGQTIASNVGLELNNGVTFTPSVNGSAAATGVPVSTTDHAFAATRTSSTSITAYVGGVPAGTQTYNARSSQPSSGVMSIGYEGTLNTGNRIAIAYSGYLPTDAMVHDLHVCLSNYLSAIGAQ